MKFVFDDRQLKIARAMYLHIGADLLPVITSARNDMFSWDQKHLIDMDLLYMKQPKNRFLIFFHEDPLAPSNL